MSKDEIAWSKKDSNGYEVGEIAIFMLQVSYPR